ncbi:hypothetical protein Syun_020282 [Stephania yunnanensis]|uniref:Uncharacterized protein n=1 Tax=Stephania yunnanensis TaxID=152371 RepID=A0AAP0NPV0_9MAGN
MCLYNELGWTGLRCQLGPVRPNGSHPSLEIRRIARSGSLIKAILDIVRFYGKSALLASKRIKIRSTENSDSVIDLFRENGFTDAQIRGFINKRPRVLLSRPNTIKPRFEFLRSLKISNDELWILLRREPMILTRSLKTMASNVNFVRSLVHTEGKVFLVIKQLYRYLQCDLERIMGPNILILRTHGVPELIIARLLVIQATALMLNVNRFEGSVVAAEKLGFKPTSVGFVLAVRTMVVVSELSWDRKMRTFKSTGWSEDEIFAAFKLQPMMMLTSDKKIRKLMDFFRDKLGWETAIVVKYPGLLLLSLEKRIIPRCLVLEVLVQRVYWRKTVMCLK